MSITIILFLQKSLLYYYYYHTVPCNLYYYYYMCTYPKSALYTAMIIFQVDRAAVEGYTGTGDPPCFVMKLEADSNRTTPPNLSLPVTLTGVRELNGTILIERLAEGNVIFSKCALT